MNIQEKEKQVRTLLSKINFSELWPDFNMFRFALYNEHEVCLEGRTFPRTNQFYANTSILYNDEYIAIWQITDDADMEILASKLAHEMFHAFQMKNHEARFPNELEAVINYHYDPYSFSIKMLENELILELIDNFSLEKYQYLLSLRKKRLCEFSYEYNYEAAIEQIEGTANYIELVVLKVLSLSKYEQKLSEIKESITSINHLFPIRIISYDIGALLIKVIIDNHQEFDFTFSDVPFAVKIIENSQRCNDPISTISTISTTISTFYENTKKIINDALKNDQWVLSGDYELLGINVYDARYYNNYLVSTYFVMYKDNDLEKVLEGDFVIELNEQKRIKKIWKI